MTGQEENRRGHQIRSLEVQRLIDHPRNLVSLAAAGIGIGRALQQTHTGQAVSVEACGWAVMSGSGPLWVGRVGVGWEFVRMPRLP